MSNNYSTIEGEVLVCRKFFGGGIVKYNNGQNYILFFTCDLNKKDIELVKKGTILSIRIQHATKRRRSFIKTIEVIK